MNTSYSRDRSNRRAKSSIAKRTLKMLKAAGMQETTRAKAKNKKKLIEEAKNRK
jgi:hypothetical protein